MNTYEEEYKRFVQVKRPIPVGGYVGPKFKKAYEEYNPRKTETVKAFKKALEKPNY